MTTSTDYASLGNFLANDADRIYTANLSALNSSGVEGLMLLGVDENDDGTGTVTVSVVASGATPDMQHAQHIHGRFDADGNPIDSFTPTLADDADLDGTVEVLEGVAQYGDVLLALTDGMGAFPTPDSDGNIAFTMTYDITDATNFVSPVSSNQYSYADVADFGLREYVLHGLQVQPGTGAGTAGEVEGTGGYIPFLPAAAGELQQISVTEALAAVGVQQAQTGIETLLTAGDDVFDARGGRDTVYGSTGNDAINGGDSGDMLLGGAGDDTLMGEAGDDTLSGSDGMDMIDGGAGDDKLWGGAGDDSVHGGSGDDVAVGNAGNDMIWGESGNDQINGGAGDDSLMGGSGIDLIGGGSGDDMIMGGGDMDRLFGGAGADEVRGGDGDDAIVGQAGDDRLFGDAGNDTLGGGAGNDLLVGGDGEDAIFGGDGLDIIGGLAGNDAIHGGADADEFHFNAGTGTDVILDFTQGEDVISLLDAGAVDFANSTEDTVRGDSDLDAADFDTITMLSDLDAANDQQVVYSTGGTDDLEMMTGAAVEAYIAATDGTDTTLYYDDDWSSLEGREAIAVLQGLDTAMTVSDFDVY